MVLAGLVLWILTALVMAESSQVKNNAWLVFAKMLSFALTTLAVPRDQLPVLQLYPTVIRMVLVSSVPPTPSVVKLMVQCLETHPTNKSVALKVFVLAAR